MGVRESASIDKQKEILGKFLSKVELTDKFDNVIIMGDFNVNIDPTNNDNDPVNIEMKDKLLDILPLAGLKQTVTKCSRQVNGQKASMIDHAWVSNMTKHVKTTIWTWTVITI